KYRYAHLVDSLMFLPYGVAVDAFQHIVYEQPDLSPKQRKAEWRKLEQQFLPHKDYDGHAFLESGGFWQTQAHIYQSPFYYIDYTLAQMCAFQFWHKAQIDKDDAFTDYVKLCKAGGSKSFLELVAYAGLQSPFDETMFASTISKIGKYLTEVDDVALNS
ncbi:MAG TPA: M3 family metallopeptidase, partial [Chitinophagales bacterium]|nr:M3 family metallopeptidase [Chitinophagales bacterium]